jgi:protein TIF31
MTEVLSGQEKIKQLAEKLSEPNSPSNPPSSIMVNELESKLISESESIEATAAERTTAATDENELVLVQDSSFTVKIQVPGVELFDLQVTSMELVQEIHQMLMDKEETCHRTCFSLQLDGVPMDKFSELKTYEGCRDGAVIKLVEEPYTVREVRVHVRHVNELIHSIDPIDNFNGTNCNSLSYVNDITSGDVSKTKSDAQQAEDKDHIPPEYILPSVKDRDR